MASSQNSTSQREDDKESKETMPSPTPTPSLIEPKPERNQFEKTPEKTKGKSWARKSPSSLKRGLSMEDSSGPNTPMKMKLVSNDVQSSSRRLAADLLRKYRSAQIKFMALAKAAGTFEICEAVWSPLRNFEDHLETLAGPSRSKSAYNDEFGSGSDSTDDETFTNCLTCGRKERGVIMPCLHRGCILCVRIEQCLNKGSSCAKCRICDGVAQKIKRLPEEI